MKDSFRPREDLLKIMDDEVVQKISHGVLDTQQQLIKKAKETCTVVPPSATAPDEIIVIQTIAEWNQEYRWRLQYDNTSAKAFCACNALVHNGMPCVHIIALALHDSEKYKIPYSSFNRRFNRDLTQALTEPVGEQQSRPAREQQLIPAKAKKRPILPDADSQHIVAASLNALYNDENSIKIRGMIQMIELAMLKLVDAGMPVRKVVKQCLMFYKIVKKKTKRLNSLCRQNGIIPHAKTRARARSYMAVPLELRQTRRRLEKMLRKRNRTKNKK